MLSLGMTEISQEINITEETINKDTHICDLLHKQVPGKLTTE